jgi:pimeloyl-ACP methyl ester carboxylesterase
MARQQTASGRQTAAVTGATGTAHSDDGTTIGYLSVGSGPSVVVIPGVLSMAADYAAFARSLAEWGFAVHTIERRGRGASGPQGDDYSIVKEREDVLAVRCRTGASLLVGHSYGGLIALEAGRTDRELMKIAVYEPGVSIDGSMPVNWMPAYEKSLAHGRRVDALVDFTLADAPPPINRIPRPLMKVVMCLLSIKPQYRQMLDLLPQNLREWKEIGRLDGTCEDYRQIAAGVLLLYGGKSRSRAVDLVAERLPRIVPDCQVRAFPRLDHFGIERAAPHEVAAAVAGYFLK